MCEQGKATADEAILESTDHNGHLSALSFKRTSSQHEDLDGFVCYKSEFDPDLFRLIKQKLIFRVNSEISYLQDHRILDKYFYHDGKLGLDTENNLLTVWAPRAIDVTLLVYSDDRKLKKRISGMPSFGIWQFQVDNSMIADMNLYKFEVTQYYPERSKFSKLEITDPYALSSAYHSRYSRFVDIGLIGPEVKASQNTHDLSTRSDHVIYETHVRDLSIADKKLSRQHRGKWSALYQENSSALKHLKLLRESGLNTIQFLPVNDYATVDEDISKQLNLDDSFASYCQRFKTTLCSDYFEESIDEVIKQLSAGSQQRQQILRNLAKNDGFNWGYDPVHYQALENSYSSLDDGIQVIREFKTALNKLKEIGFHVSLDVVFNHTYQSGLQSFSVLDKIVPNYYHRRHPVSGEIYRSSCCENTASENRMMEKLIIDTLVSYREHYKIDAFRFDLMGHHTLENMKKIKAALGRDVYIYGEGWHFGEMTSLKIENARQELLFDTNIGSFNDRFRDLVRGGSPFDCGYKLQSQSFVTGLSLFDNDLSLIAKKNSFKSCYDKDSFKKEELSLRRQRTLVEKDLLRASILGNLKSNNLLGYADREINTSDLTFRGSKLAYSANPNETINYVSKHDNQTLWDNTQYKLPLSMPLDERIALHSLQLSYPLFSFGVPFIHMGSEIIRSKAFARDSYNSGDFFNRVDFSMNSSVWKRAFSLGDARDKDFMVDIYKKADIDLTKRERKKVLSRFLEDLRIRDDLEFFGSNDAEFIKENVKFLNTGSKQNIGLIAYKVQTQSRDVLIVFNNDRLAHSLQLDSDSWQVHPEIKELRLENRTLEIPSLSRIVLIQDKTQEL